MSQNIFLILPAIKNIKTIFSSQYRNEQWAGLDPQTVCNWATASCSNVLIFVNLKFLVKKKLVLSSKKL